MITLLQLDYFRKLAAVEHITKTAQELRISQTALSSMIINLERELGVQLFDRSKRTIRLNDAGRLYLKYVNDVFTAVARIERCVVVADVRNACIAEQR